MFVCAGPVLTPSHPQHAHQPTHTHLHQLQSNAPVIIWCSPGSSKQRVAIIYAAQGRTG